MSGTRLRPWIVGLLALAACSRISPEPVSGEQRMLVLAYDASSNDGQYKLVIGRVTTLHDLRTLDGDAAKIMAGAVIRDDQTELTQGNPQTADDITKITTKTAGRPVDFSYFEVDGIIHPEDFDSLNLATIYYNFERSHLYFADLNAALYDLPVQYFPSFTDTSVSNQPLTDNAFWDPISRQFMILPFKQINELPLGMNVGVVAHEYTHAVFSNRFYQSQDGIPWLAEKGWQDPEKYARAENLERSVNEGLADLFGALVSGDPAFIRKSLSMINEERRLDPPSPRCYTKDLRDALENTPHDKYDPYPVGSVLASALWTVASDAGDRQQAFAQSLVDGMAEMGARFQAKDSEIALPDALDGLVSIMVEDLRPEACGLLLDRFHLTASAVPSCVEVHAPEETCP